MNEDDQFTLPAITNDDIRWACRQLREVETAFHGIDGADMRAVVLREMENLDVAACPGSGKTTLLVAKLAILAQKWDSSTRGICVLSHTNVAREEIERRLGCSPAALRLLGYPHFVGTIHGFANEFLAVPWLRSLGYPIRTIDSEIAAAKRWKDLSFGARTYLEKVGFSEYQLTAKTPDFSVGEVSAGGGKLLGTHTETYKEMCKVCADSAKEGVFSHSEMFMWARDCLDKHPEIIPVIRARFPMLLVDECQDNNKEQSSLLYRMFCQGGGAVICQRFGDANQAIFDDNLSDEPTIAEHAFPQAAIKKDLPNSHRFGQRIADLADPLGLVPYGLKGHGPKCPLNSGAAEAEHTIFLFKDAAGAERILPNFGELLFATFSDAELARGSFKAVGQVHKKPENDKFPSYVGHYFPSYDPATAKLEPRPTSFVGYLLTGQERGRQKGLLGVCAQTIADGVLHLARRMQRGLDLPKRLNRHRLICELIQSDVALLDAYQSLVVEISLNCQVEKNAWEQKWRKVIHDTAVKIAGTPLVAAFGDFLKWPDPVQVNGALAAPPLANGQSNLYRHTNGNREAVIQVGSIHSVKGETHTATLLLETHYYERNIDSIKDWLLAKRSGAKAGKTGTKRVNQRLKLHYVAMSRPSHLVCVAMCRSSFETGGNLDAAAIAQLESRGWKVREI